MEFSVGSYLDSKFKNIEKTPEALRAAATAIADSQSFFSTTLGSTRPVSWAQEALSYLNDYDKGQQFDERGGKQVSKLDLAYDWLTGSAQSHSSSRLLSRSSGNVSEILAKYRNAQENVANITDFRNSTPEQQQEILNSSTYKSHASTLKGLEDQILSLQDAGMSLDIKPLTRDAAGNYVTASAPQAATAVPTATSSTPSSSAQAAADAFKPTEYSDSNQLSELQKTVMGTASSLKANDAFINGVFKAFHNRDATAEELSAYRNKEVGTIRTEIIGGAQAAGLPTVAPGTVDVPTGMMTPEEAVTQGLQKVLRPDQLSAFREDQIIRDNRGGVYLNTETTTQEQRDAVSSGRSGNQIGTVQPPIVGTPSASAPDLENASSAPDAEQFLESFSADSGASSADLVTSITDTATRYLGTIVASYDQQIAELQRQVDASKGELSGLTGRISDLTTATPNADALAAASELQGLQEKQAKLMEIKTQIIAEQERLSLGLINESNKLAPLSIIGARQATLQAQGLARIGALTAIAQVYQEDLNFAKSMVDATVTAMNADRTLQLSALDTLVDLKGKEIIQLTSEETAMIEARQSAINKAIDTAQKDADRVFELIKDNPDAALKGGVLLSDSGAVALSKMAPYLSAADRETQVIDLGGTKQLIDSATGETIRTFEESLTPGEGTTWKDITKDDGSIVRIFTDANGMPTGKTVEIMTADESAKLEKLNTEVASSLSAITTTDSSGNTKSSWEAERQRLHALFPEVPMDIIDKQLGGGVTISQSKDWRNLDEFIKDYPGLKAEANYWKDTAKYSDKEVINYLEKKYVPSFNDVGTDTNSGASIVKLTANFPAGSYAGQCGAFVNDITKLGLGDSYESKLKKMDPEITAASAQSGDVFVMEYRDYGHTGIILSKTPKADGTFDYLVVDSNSNLDEKIAYHTINSSRITGYARVPFKSFTSRYTA